MSLTQDLRWSLGWSIALQLQRQTDLLLCTINCFLHWDHLPNMAVGDLAFYYTLYLWFRVHYSKILLPFLSYRAFLDETVLLMLVYAVVNLHLGPTLKVGRRFSWANSLYIFCIGGKSWPETFWTGKFRESLPFSAIYLCNSLESYGKSWCNIFFLIMVKEVNYGEDLRWVGSG